MCQEKSYHHQNLLGELIRAGISIMNSEGESNLTIRKIATAYHVSHAAPYRHFEDKEALLDSMQKYIEDEFTTALQNSLNDYATPETNMASFGKAYVTFFSENPDYYLFFIRYQTMDIHLQSVGELHGNYPPFKLFCKLAKSYLDSVALPQEGQSSFMIGMWATVHGLAGLSVMSGVKCKEGWSEITKAVLNIRSNTTYESNFNKHK